MIGRFSQRSSHQNRYKPGVWEVGPGENDSQKNWRLIERLHNTPVILPERAYLIRHQIKWVMFYLKKADCFQRRSAPLVDMNEREQSRCTT
jgi:hypothetical protein